MEIAVDVELLIKRATNKVVQDVINKSLIAPNTTTDALHEKVETVIRETVTNNSVALENTLIELTSTKLADETMLIIQGIGAGVFNKMETGGE